MELKFGAKKSLVIFSLLRVWLTGSLGWTGSYALSVLRSKFESEKRYQEVSYVDDLIRKEREELEPELAQTATTTMTTNTVAEEITATRQEIVCS
jgi:hypothetical protein